MALKRQARIRASNAGMVSTPIPQRATNQVAHMAAPIGGINALLPASEMPPTDCLALNNLIPFQYGLRVRSGWREWATNVGSPVGTGLSPLTAWQGFNPHGVRTIMSFTGKTPAGDRLFACTPDGIYNCSTQGAKSVSNREYTFPIGSGLDYLGNQIFPAGAGEGIYTSVSSAAGPHYIAYCDEANGYLLYQEGSGTWTKIVAGTGLDGKSIAGANPEAFRFAMSWKNRLWFTSDNSSIAYYLPVNQYAGTVSQIDFGSRFRYGGSLVGLWSWTVDGGTGIDDYLVGISDGGDVVIYRGTDPTFVETFGLQGVWWAGQVPPGRKIASDFGGDLFILSRLGCLPLSKLVSGGLIRDPSTFATEKVANLFNILMTDRGHLPGWSIRMHPTDNLMMISVPALPSQPQQIMAMALASKGWAQQFGIPMTCMEPWGGSLYFGTADGRVCINEGFVDGQKLDGTNANPINASVMSAYSMMGSAKKKRIHMVRPYFYTDGNQPGYSAEARYDFDLSDIGTGASPLTIPANAWDTGLWDTMLWGDDNATANKVGGTSGMGTSAAIIVRVTAESNTTLIGYDVVADQGGIL